MPDHPTRPVASVLSGTLDGHQYAGCRRITAALDLPRGLQPNLASGGESAVDVIAIHRIAVVIHLTGGDHADVAAQDLHSDHGTLWRKRVTAICKPHDTHTDVVRACVKGLIGYSLSDFPYDACELPDARLGPALLQLRLVLASPPQRCTVAGQPLWLAAMLVALTAGSLAWGAHVLAKRWQPGHPPMPMGADSTNR